jgi:hypothetical protein
MDILLNYNSDRLNGFSLVSKFEQLKGLTWGSISSSFSFLCGTLCVLRNGLWRVLVYKDNPDIDQFLFHQLVDIDEVSYGMPMRVAITDVTNKILCVLNNYTNHVLVYNFDEFEHFQLVQTITVPHNGPNVNSERITMYENFMCVSDYTYDDGSGHIGIVFIYLWDPVSQNYSLSDQLVCPLVGDFGFGFDVSLKETTLFVGAPYCTTAVSKDGRVLVYNYNLGVWNLSTNISGPAFVNGYFGWSVSCNIETISPTPIYRAVIGNPGANSAQGQALFYNSLNKETWTLNTTMQAPLAYRQNGNQFGSSVCIYRSSAGIGAGEELGGQGALYVYNYNGVNWALGVKDDLTPARYTQVGATQYGEFIANTQDNIGMTFYDLGRPSFVIINKNVLGTWKSFTILVAEKLYVKYTVDQSFYHLASGNQTIKFRLESPITGNFRVILDMENALMTIGPQNNKIYFVENGIYKMATLAYGNYTGDGLAAYVQTKMNAISIWANNYTILYNSVSNKFTVQALNPFAFGSNLTNSLNDSCQVKTMGFYDNNDSTVHILYASDIEASLSAPEQIGVNILEGYPVIPARNNCIFAETGLRANLVGGRYVITKEDDFRIHIPQKTSQLTFVFPDINGGVFLRVNTNDITARLTAV